MVKSIQKSKKAAVGTKEVAPSKRAAKPATAPKARKDKPAKAAPSKSGSSVKRVKPAPAASVKSKPQTKPAKQLATAKVAPAPARRAPPKKKLAQLGLFEWVRVQGSEQDPSLVPFSPMLKDLHPALARVPVLGSLVELSKSSATRPFEVWGLLGQDFASRTGLSNEGFRQAITANPGYEVYFCSAHPEVEAIYHNPWRAPLVTHPEFLRLSRAFLSAANLSETVLDSLCHSGLFATGHLVAGTRTFWDGYLKFATEAVCLAYERMDSSLRAEIFNETTASGRMTHLELICARLLGYWLMAGGANTKAFKVALPQQEGKLNSHVQFLREMKDFGIEQRSRWHVASWLNYRGLYLAHVMGKAWILKHIDEITPKKLLIAAAPQRLSWAHPRALA